VVYDIIQIQEKRKEHNHINQGWISLFYVPKHIQIKIKSSMFLKEIK